jgi:hypothetical protein
VTDLLSRLSYLSTKMIELGRTKQNKPCIIIDKHKFRKDRVLASGDISWRCLGTACNASVRTDSKIGDILSIKSNHTGLHPPSTLADASIMSITLSPGSPSHTVSNIDSSPCYRSENSPITPLRRSSDVSTSQNKFDSALFEQMRTTIEVLESDNGALREEICLLRKELSSAREFYGLGACYEGPGRHAPISLRNRFEMLDNEQDMFPPLNPGGMPETARKRNRGKRPIKEITRTVNTTSVERKPKVLLLADSHGKEMGSLLYERLGSAFDTTVISRSGAPFNSVACDAGKLSKNFGTDDRVIILGGTNDVVDHDHQSFNFNLDVIEEIAQHTNVTVASIPYRYDKPLMNVNVHKLNQQLAEGLDKITNVNVLDLSFFNITDYTNHGLHLNFKKGKRKLRCVNKCNPVSEW